MAKIKRYIGEDIAVPIKRRISTGLYRNLDDYEEILVYFSNLTKQVKFSKTGATGTTALIRVDEYTYLAQLTSANTTLLGRGTVTISIEFTNSDNIGDNETDQRVEGVVFTLEKTRL